MTKKLLSDAELEFILGGSYDKSDDSDLEEQHLDSDLEDSVKDENEDEYEEVEYLETSAGEEFSEDELFDRGFDEDEIKYPTVSRIEWNSKPHKRKQDSPNFEAALRNGSENITSIKDSFGLFISKDMINDICSFTNQKRSQNTSDITENEVLAFIGILLASAKYRGGKLCLNELWNSNVLFKQHFYPASMSRSRFMHIFDQIKFNSDEGLDQSPQILNMMNQFRSACQYNYSASSQITVDEHVAVFQGKSPFSKGQGMKFLIAADSDTSYILNFQMFTKDPTRSILDLLKPFYGSHRNITAGCNLTSITLARRLLRENLTITGVVGNEEGIIPVPFLPQVEREEFSSIFGFLGSITLVSYVPKKRCAVAVLSSKFHDAEIDRANKNIPQIVKYLNETKKSVHKISNIMHNYSCVRTTRRWPFRMFMEILNMAVYNAYCVWSMKNPDWKKSYPNRRRCFIQELAIELVKNNIEDRKRRGILYFHKKQLESFSTYDRATSSAKKDPEEEEEETKPEPSQRNELVKDVKRLRCPFCPHAESYNHKTKIRCNQCLEPVCADHKFETILCLECQDSSCKPVPTQKSPGKKYRRCAFCHFRVADNKKTKEVCSVCEKPVCVDHRSQTVLCPNCKKAPRQKKKAEEPPDPSPLARAWKRYKASL